MDIKNNQQVYLNLIFPIVILGTLVLALQTAFQKISIRWDNGDNSYCYLIIPLFIYLCWDRKEYFKFKEFSWNYLGIVPLVLSTGLIIIGELGSVETLLYVGLWGCIVSYIIGLYGKRIFHLVFPIFILCFMVPLPPFINKMLTFKLRVAASSISANMLQLSGVSVLREGNILDLGIDKLQVVDACSGLRYLMPMFLMAFLVGYFFNKTLWQRLVLVAIVIPLSVVVNSFRIYATGILTVHGYQKYAQDFYHDFSGWLVFMVAGAILVGVSFLLKRFSKESPEVTPKLDDGAEKIGMIRPIILTTIFCMLFATTGYTINNASKLQIRPERIKFKEFPLNINGWEGAMSYLSEEVLNSLWADDYVQATYRKKGIRNSVMLFIPYYEYQGTRHTAHAPQSCLLGGGWAIMSSELKDIAVTKDDTIQLKSMVMGKGDARLLSSYFFFQRGRVITSPWANKYYLMVDAITRKRTDGSLVRIEMMIPDGQSVDDAYGVLENFLKDVWGVLPDYVPN